jgi:riboflavin biosynthesis pyrimidine reductase
VGTVIDDKPHGTVARHPRWERLPRAALLGPYRALPAPGRSQRQAATRREGPRTTLQAGRAWQERLDACLQVGAFFASVPGLACLRGLLA